MELNPSKYAVLTGAGFLKDFGGYLASEMHEKILNHPQVSELSAVRELLLEDFDYESVYSKVLNGDYEDEEKKTLEDAMFDIYRQMDDDTKDYCHNRDESRGIAWPGVSSLLATCTRENGKRGYLFTTNQDIFLERQCGHRSGLVPRIGGNQIGLGPRAKLKHEHYVQLPNEEELEKLKQQFSNSGNLQYIKLHGSLGWLSAVKDSSMVIGKAKIADIEKEPVLSLYYHSIFKGVLKQGGCCLLVIGYGFNDEHINNVIVEAVSKHGLKLYPVTSSGPKSLKEKFDAVDPLLWKNLGGYFNGSIKEQFPYGSDQIYRKKIEYIFRSMGIIE